MTQAIYSGMLYGVIAGFAVLGFILTGTLIWGAIELITYILCLTERKEHHEQQRGDGE